VIKGICRYPLPFDAPWAIKTYDGREKSLLRGAAADVLPESVRQRVKSPYPATQDPGYDAVLRERAREVLRSGDSPAFQIIDSDKVRAIVDRPEVCGASPVRASLERSLQLDQWLREYRVGLAV
jgi:asparagine synthase (glutamine-hydrolysing)